MSRVYRARRRPGTLRRLVDALAARRPAAQEPAAPELVDADYEWLQQVRDEPTSLLHTPPAPGPVPAAAPPAGRHHPETVSRVDATYNPLPPAVRAEIAPSAWIRAGVDDHTGRLDVSALAGVDPEIDLSLDRGPTVPITPEQAARALVPPPDARMPGHLTSLAAYQQHIRNQRPETKDIP